MNKTIQSKIRAAANHLKRAHAAMDAARDLSNQMPERSVLGDGAYRIKAAIAHIAEIAKHADEAMQEHRESIAMDGGSK